MKENLNKENFWNETYKTYPNACKLFCEWIDKYKKENKWDELFNNEERLEPNINNPFYFNKMKYHDIPLSMQLGIFHEFAIEILGSDKVSYPSSISLAKAYITHTFHKIELGHKRNN